MNFPGNRAQSGLTYSNSLPLCQNSKNLMSHSWENCKMFHGQTGNSDFIGPSVGWGSIIETILSFPEFTSMHQKRDYSINFFMRYSQF